MQTTLPSDYREFITKFGAGIFGDKRVYGVGRAREMSNEEGSCDQMTTYYKTRKRWPGIDDWVIIASDGSGNPIGLRQDGTVWMADHDRRTTTRIRRRTRDWESRRRKSHASISSLFGR